MLRRVRHSKTLPRYITSNQLADVSQEIYSLIDKAVTPLVDGNPQYVAITLTLEQLKVALDQLDLAHKGRKFKSARQHVGVGGADGQLEDETFSFQKRSAYMKRKALMKRFRFLLDWKLIDAEEDRQPEVAAAAKAIRRVLNRRVDDFERISYEESANQFRYFFDELDANSEAVTAVSTLDLSKVYNGMKQAQNDYKVAHEGQTRLDAEREEMPKITPMTDEVRRITRVLLTMLHFDVAAGNEALNEVLGHVDELIDKVRAVAKRRRTLAELEKAQADADAIDDTDPSSGSPDADPAVTPSDTPDDTPDAPDDTPDADPDLDVDLNVAPDDGGSMGNATNTGGNPSTITR